MPVVDFYLNLDPTGSVVANMISDERHTLPQGNVRLIFPRHGCFFTDSLLVGFPQLDGSVIPLIKNEQYVASEMLAQVTRQCGREIHCSILILDPEVSGEVAVYYRALGGADSVNTTLLTQAINQVTQGDTVDWSGLVHPQEYRPAAHRQDSADVYGAEYLTQAIARIQAVVDRADTALHQQITRYFLPAAKNRFYTAFNTQANEQLDLIAASTDAAVKTVQLTHDLLSDIDQSTLTMSEKIKSLNDTIERHAKDCENSIYAIGLMQLTRQQHAFSGTIFQTPLYLEDLECWIDFTDNGRNAASATSFVTRDKSKHERIYSSTTAKRVWNPALKAMVAEFKASDAFEQIAGKELVIRAPMTMLVITTRTGSMPEKLSLLSGSQHELKMDIRARSLMRLEKTNGQAASIAIDCDRSDNFAAHLGIFTLDEKGTEGYALGNSLQHRGPLTRGMASKPTLGSETVDIRRLGGGVDQSGGIAEILIYNRQLSQYEIDALVTYVNLAYGIAPNLITNGNFNDGLSGFETDYDVSMLGQVPGEVAVLYKETVTKSRSAFSDFYIFPNFTTVTRMMPERNQFLAVNTHVDTTKAFWKQTIHTQAKVNHELTLTLLYNPLNPPLIAVAINGIRHSKLQALSSTVARVDKVQYAFTPETDEVTIELFNLNTSGTINTFAIDNIALRRQFFAVST